MNRIRDLLIFALCILLALAPAVSANSGPSEWTGTDITGVASTADQCPIEVVEEQLTFDIPELPLAYWEYREEPDSFGGYTASVTAEYVFRNPTDSDVTATLLFPLGDWPQYAPGNVFDLSKFGVWVDGAPVELELRHTFVDGMPFTMERNAADIRDGIPEHEFYSPDLPVIKYTYRITGAEFKGLKYEMAKLHIDSDPSRTKVMLDPARSAQVRENDTMVGTALNEDGTVSVWIIGEIPEKPYEWTTLEGEMELVSTESSTFWDLALSQRPEDSLICEEDWYHIVLDRMEVSQWEHGYLFHSVLYNEDYSVMPWYRYQLKVPAGGTAVNTVTAPVYPYMNVAWTPYIYTYRYLLSPARGWADFGPLDIEIKTPYYMTQCNLEGFEKTGEGYSLHLDGLPDKELEFVLSEKANPRKPGTLPLMVRLLPILLICVGVVKLIQKFKKKK